MTNVIVKSKNYDVWVPAIVMQFVCEETMKSLPNETGGVLMGMIDQYNNIFITEVIGPGPSAEHHLASFTPDYNWQEDKIAKIYQDSKRRKIYLGDWHSHPSGNTSLSRKDKKTLKNIANYPDARIQTPIMAILGRSDGWQFEVWRYFKKSIFLNGLFSLDTFVSINVNVID
jgi:integrative and conjugative element protein (TIGR02256 family)